MTLDNHLNNPGPSRRQFLGYAATATLAYALGCGKDQEPGSSGSSSQKEYDFHNPQDVLEAFFDAYQKGDDKLFRQTTVKQKSINDFQRQLQKEDIQRISDYKILDIYKKDDESIYYNIKLVFEFNNGKKIKELSNDKFELEKQSDGSWKVEY